MRKALGKSRASTPKPFYAEFWEVWLLAVVLVTVLGLFAQTKHSHSLSRADLQHTLDPYDVRPEDPTNEPGALESGR